MPIILYSQEVSSASDKIEIIEKWMERSPTLPDPHYYKACSLLVLKDYSEFVNSANQYLFMESQGKSVVMMKYYLAAVLLTHKKDFKGAIKQIIPCLSVRPLMAEFWCLLADIYYQMKEYKKSKSLYVNAVMMGRKRLSNDDWPMDVSKYKKHPIKMISSCEKIIKETKAIV